MHVRAPWPSALAALLLLLLVPACGDETGTSATDGDDAPREVGESMVVREEAEFAALRKRYTDAVAFVEAKRKEILPDESERRWEEIDFLPSYAVGLKAASDQEKPLMLWVMNGHPLGCT